MPRRRRATGDGARHHGVVGSAAPRRRPWPAPDERLRTNRTARAARTAVSSNDPGHLVSRARLNPSGRTTNTPSTVAAARAVRTALRWVETASTLRGARKYHGY